MEIYSINTPVFTGYKSAFSRKFEQAINRPTLNQDDQKNLLAEFNKMYAKRVKSENKIGSGFYGTVYKIDDSYVLKRGNERVEPDLKGIKILKNKKFSQLKHYFGEAIAKIINNYGEDMLILRNVYSKGKSIPVGIPDEFAKTHTKEECLKYYNEVYLPKFAKLPQKSFDGIAQDFAKLNKRCKSRKSYFFDYINPNNFVLCGKTIRILDDINEENYVKTSNCVTDMLDVFINRMDMDSESVFDEKLIPLRRELIKKIILAGVRHKVPMCQSDADYFSWFKALDKINVEMEIDTSELMMRNITKLLDDIVKKNPSPKKRVEIAKKYLDDILG